MLSLLLCVSDFSADLLGLDVESWSLAVCPEFCRLHERHTVKRQDVIYGETLLLPSSFYFSFSSSSLRLLFGI